MRTKLVSANSLDGGPNKNAHLAVGIRSGRAPAYQNR
jgi:hypothetical protein